MAEDKKDTISFKDTLNLPKTEFPIRSNHKELDAQMLKRWCEQDLCGKAFTHNAGAEKFILHDGPPYVNGPIHLGHAYNKILKDLVTKSKRMAGYQVPVTPGFDCHGLPIEINVSKKFPSLDRITFIKHCREYAQHWLEIQTEQFKALGVLMDWAHPYTTMSHAYESAIVEALGVFVERGFVERKYKSVSWCPTCRTSLATAEIEYKDRQDPSIYVLFPLEQRAAQKLFPDTSHNAISLLIWTTTPWTIPLNRAVAVHPGINYQLIRFGNNVVLVAEALVNQIAKIMGVQPEVLATVAGKDLVGLTVVQPLTGKIVPVIADPEILLTEGTACVHIAPGCGQQDYELGVRNNLEIYSPVTPSGHYTSDVIPAELVGMSVNDAQQWVRDRLQEEGRLLFAGTVQHSYPHCWRCRKGLIFRATKQWFLSLQREQLQDEAIKAISSIAFIPEQSRNHLKAAVESRLEWCISRQKVWGVPITALLCKKCDHAFISKEFADRVAAQIAEHGIEYWEKVSAKELSHNVTCPHCGACDFEKERDILDVWFDSGVSHYAVLNRNLALAFPADVYLEAREQARGWFQSSLLTSLVLERQACMRTIIAHGFTVDAQRTKMSKSLGNVVSPFDIIEQYGTDVLRLWVASIDYVDDAVISDVLLKNLQEVYRKLRNTTRFLLSNLYDFSIKKDAVSFDQLQVIDICALRSLVRMSEEVRAAYDRADFTFVMHRLTDYCTNELSSLYLDIIKDRLYVEKATGVQRRSAQTVCWHILDAITKLMAPILSFTAEQISDFYQSDKTQSIHLQSFANLSAESKDGDVIFGRLPITLSDIPAYEALWDTLLAMRDAILKAIEKEREKGVVKHSLESRVLIFIDKDMRTKLDFLFKLLSQHNQSLEDFLSEFCIISEVSLLSDNVGLEASTVPGFFVKAERAQGTKCPRCWQYKHTTHAQGLCERCAQVICARN